MTKVTLKDDLLREERQQNKQKLHRFLIIINIQWNIPNSVSIVTVIKNPLTITCNTMMVNTFCSSLYVHVNMLKSMRYGRMYIWNSTWAQTLALGKCEGYSTIWGPHSSVAEDWHLPECYAVSGKQLHVSQMFVLPLCSWSSSPTSVVSAYPITLLQMKELQCFGTLGTIYPVAKHDTPDDLNLLLMINLWKGHVIPTGLKVA